MLSCNRYHAYHYDGDNSGCNGNNIGNNGCGCGCNGNTDIGNNSCSCHNNTCGCGSNLLGCAADGFVNTAFRIIRGLDNSLSCGCGCRGEHNDCGCR